MQSLPLIKGVSLCFCTFEFKSLLSYLCFSGSLLPQQSVRQEKHEKSVQVPEDQRTGAVRPPLTPCPILCCSPQGPKQNLSFENLH